MAVKIAMLFPGYGSQFVGMAKEFYDESRIVQEYFEEASNCLNINFVKLCFASSESELRKIETAYPVLFLVSTAIAALLKEQGIQPSIVAGYQMGQCSAVASVGGFSFPDGLYFLSKYATYYQELLQTLDVRALTVDGISCAAIQELCASVPANDLALAICKSEQSALITGSYASMNKFEKKIQSMPVKITEGSTQAGLYSSLMHGVVEHLNTYVVKIDFKDLSTPIVSGTNGLAIQTGKQVKQLLVDDLAQVFRWDKVLQHVAQCDLILEVGPGTALTRSVQELFPEKTSIAVNKLADVLQVQKIIEEKNKFIE